MAVTGKRPAPKEHEPRKRQKPYVESSLVASRKARVKAENGVLPQPKNKRNKFKPKEDDRKPKRKAPITSSKPIKDESDTDDGDEDDGEGFGGFGEAGEDDDEMAEVDEMEVDEGESSDKTKSKPLDKQNHIAQRQAAKERRLQRPHGELLLEAKSKWELARRANISKEERQKYVHQLAETVKGKVKELVTRHDASRIIQTVVKHGSQADRDQVALELKGAYLKLTEYKYSKHLLLKLIRRCPAHRSSILSEWHGHVIRLLLHKEATSIVSDAFDLYASREDKNLLIRDFYGKEVALFDNEKVKSGGLQGVLEAAEPTRKARVLGALKANLLRIFNNPDKGAVGHPVVHRALWEYLQEVSHIEPEEEQTKARTEMFESCFELLAEMAHTKDGSRAVREFVAWGTAKDRKKILKTFKPHLEKMCTDDQAQLVLFTCLDAVDDTKLLQTSFINDVISLAPKLVFTSSASDSESSPTTSGRRSLLYLLVPRDSRYFPPALVRTIAETDSIVAKTSKKDSDIRRKEILAGASAGLLKFVKDEAGKLLKDPAASLLTADIMLFTEGDKTAATNALIQPLIDSPYPPTGNDPHPIDVPHSSRVFKTLLQGGHFSQKTKTVHTVPTFSAISFARSMLQDVGQEKLPAMATTSGGSAFVFVELLERIFKDGTDEERKSLKEWVKKEGVLKEVENSNAKGKEALTGKVKEVLGS